MSFGSFKRTLEQQSVYCELNLKHRNTYNPFCHFLFISESKLDRLEVKSNALIYDAYIHNLKYTFFCVDRQVCWWLISKYSLFTDSGIWNGIQSKYIFCMRFSVQAPFENPNICAALRDSFLVALAKQKAILPYWVSLCWNIFKFRGKESSILASLSCGKVIKQIQYLDLFVFLVIYSGYNRPPQLQSLMFSLKFNFSQNSC